MTEKHKLIFEIMALGVLINEKTDYCVFIDFSGHVNSFDVDIRESKKNYHVEIAKTEIKTKFIDYLNKDKTDVLAILKAKRDILKQILEDEFVDTSNMEQEIYEVVKHYF